MSNILEEDDKNFYEALVEITDENFDELSKKKDALLSVGINDDGRFFVVDDEIAEDEIDEDDVKNDFFKTMT